MRRSANFTRCKSSLVLMLATVLTLTVTAVASAAVWKYKGIEVNQLREFNMVGGEVFETSPGNGMLCNVKARIRIQNGTTSEVSNYMWDGEPCMGAGTFSGCELTGWATASLPWKIGSITATNFKTETAAKIVRSFSSCPISTHTSTVNSYVWTPFDPSEIYGFEIEGKGTPVGYQSVGTLEVLPPDGGNYGIG